VWKEEEHGGRWGVTTTATLSLHYTAYRTATTPRCLLKGIACWALCAPRAFTGTAGMRLSASRTNLGGREGRQERKLLFTQTLAPITVQGMAGVALACARGRYRRRGNEGNRWRTVETVAIALSAEQHSGCDA